jgi:putative N6-adenine-specific DNA methylase
MRKQGKRRPTIDIKNPDIQLNLYINGTLAIISFDTSGKPLHKRGYRQESVQAPVQESLAAALLAMAGYQGTEILCDPCCGSGTFLIEAALMATQTAPGYLRQQWGFMHLADFSQQRWLKVKAEADAKRLPLAPKRIFGMDVNSSVVRSCQANLRAAGFHQAIEFLPGDFRDYKPSVSPSFIMANPPHGRRLDDAETLQPLYRALGDFMKQNCAAPAKGFVFTGNLKLAKEVGLAPKHRYVIDNGGIDSRLLVFDLYHS